MIRNILIVCLFALLSLASGQFYSTARAQEDISYPISELGNCNNAQTCKVYCDQPENKDTCITFAKAHGFYKKQVGKKQLSALVSAKDELGCQSLDECKAFCEQEENRLKCRSFAQKHGLSPPQTAPQDEKLLSKAQQNLNCDSYESCKTLCDQQENYTKCAALLQDQITQEERAMFEKYKPQIKEFLGCDSLVTCVAFCMNPLNTARCEEFGNKMAEEFGNPPPSESPEVWCPKASSECKWDGTNCVCNGPQTCSQNEEALKCSWDGTQCNCAGLPEEPPEVWCPKASPGGCSWDGKYCICPGTSETPIQSGEMESEEVWCPKIGPYCVWDGSSCTCWDECVKAGGNWTGQKCEYQGNTNQTTIEPNIEPTIESPEVSCVKNPDCKWTGETCFCAAVQLPQTEPTPQPAVQGTTTNYDFFQQIINFVTNTLKLPQ